MTAATRTRPSASPAAVAPTPVTTLFQGYNSFTGSACSTAVTGTSATRGASNRLDYTVCTDFESLLLALSISTSVTDSFLVGSVDAKASFVNRLNLTSYSVTVLVYASNVTGDAAYTGVQPPSTMPTDLNQFFQTYGDTFVSELTLGAEYVAAWVYYAQSKDEQTAVTSALSYHGITEEGEVSATFATSLQLATQSIQTRQTSSQLVTGITGLTLPDSPPEMIDFALGFGARQPTVPTVIAYGTTGYEHVPGFAPLFEPIVENRDLFEGTDGQAGLAADLSTLAGLKNQIAWIQQVYQTYGYTGDVDMVTSGPGGKAFQVEDDSAQLATAIDLIAQDPTKTAELPVLPSLLFGSPALSFELVPGATPPWGGSAGTATGGNPYVDVTAQSVVGQTALASLQIRGGNWVDCLLVGYRTPTQAPSVTQHGKNSGDTLSTQLTLQPGELVSSISGTAGKYVNQLTFRTTGGQTLAYPPRPQGAPQTWSWTVPAGSALVGFQGRSGADLDQLQPLVCTFSPATWR
jgi:hypothetical protein